MEANYDKLYSELRNTKSELLDRINKNTGSSVVQTIIREEIQDIELALSKIITGHYGRCELSGELIPIEVLEIIPTIKTLNEMEDLNHFFRKPLYL